MAYLKRAAVLDLGLPVQRCSLSMGFWAPRTMLHLRIGSKEGRYRSPSQWLPSVHVTKSITVQRMTFSHTFGCASWFPSHNLNTVAPEKKEDCPGPVVRVVPVTSHFSFIGHSPRLWISLRITLQNTGTKACPIWGDNLSSLKGWDVGLKRDPKPLWAPPGPSTSHTRPENQAPPDTQRWGRQPWLLNRKLWLRIVLHNLHICRIKCRALPRAGMGGSRVKSPSRGFAAWRGSTSESLSHASARLPRLSWLQFAFLLSSPPPICLIRFHATLAHIWP